MAWIEMHQSLPTHRKTLALADALGIDPAQAVGHLACFWMWALDNAPDGNLGPVGSRTIARAAQWKKDDAKFVGAMADAGFLDWGPNPAIHDWDDYAGKLIDRRARNRERMRSARTDPEPPGEPRTNGARAEHVQRTNEARADTFGATVPDRTVPDRTGPDSREPETAPSGATRAAVPKPKREHLPVDAEFIEVLAAEYGPKMGGPGVVREEIEAALNHTASKKCIDQRMYLRTWLNRDVRRGPIKANLRPMRPVDAPPEVPSNSPFLQFRGVS